MNPRLTLICMAIVSSFQLSSHASSTVKVPAPEARIWVLDNGLTIIVREDHSAPVASVQVWCKTGSIHEDKWMGAGLSHILEHMLFKGTPTRDANAITNEIQDHGGYVNAYTSFDRTVYLVDVPKEGVSASLALLADTMMNSTLPEEEYIKEQEVIRREFAMGEDSPERVQQKLLFSTTYQNHPYGLPVIGHLDVYNRLTRDDVMEYYKKRYVPNNLFFVVVGDVDAEKIKSELTTLFEKYPRGPLAPVLWPSEVPQMGRRELHEEFVTELSRLSMAWHIPSITHPDVPALDLLSVVLGGGRSSRLYRDLRDNRGLAHSISAFAYTPGETGLFGVSAVCDPDKRTAVEQSVLEIITDIQKSGIHNEELEKAKRQILASHLDSLTTMKGQAADIGSSWLLVHDLNFTQNYLEVLQKVTVEDLQNVAVKYLVDSNLTVTSLNPKGSVNKTDNKVESSTEFPIQKTVLKDGLRLLIREDPRLPLVSISMTFRGGLLAETPENNGITALFSSMLLKGTKTRSSEQIADIIESAGGSISTDSGNNSFSVRIDCLAPDVALALDLLADVTLHSVYPEQALDLEKKAQIAGIKSRQDQPTSVAGDLFRQSLFSGHPYGMNPSGTEESVSSITPDQLRAFQSAQIHAGNAVLSVFGDVKADEVKTLVTNAFSGLSPAKELAKDQTPPAFTADMDVKKAMDKSQAILMVGYRGLSLTDSDRYALALVDEACSDMGSRFFDRIREKLGLAYFISSSMSTGPVEGSFLFYLGTDPSKVDVVRKELLDEIGKLARDGLTAEELNRAKKKYLGQMQIQNQSNAALSYSTALDEIYGLGYAHNDLVPELVEKVTLEDVKRVCNKFFLNKPSVIALVAPEGK